MIDDLHVATIEALPPGAAGGHAPSDAVPRPEPGRPRHRYPTPAAFLDMMQSGADYAEANLHRGNGCEAHLIMPGNETFHGLAGEPR